jgi:hypothetical protein
MDHGGRVWRLEVLAGGDTLRQERLTRVLQDEFLKTDGVTAGFADDTVPVDGGRKGGAAGDVALWAAVGAAARPASQVVISLVKEWCGKERYRKVEVTYGGNSVTITGRPDEVQERMVREFLDKVREDDGDSSGGGAE